MKDQYFGDINDYRKYGLLRTVSKVLREPGLIAWMLTPDDASTDGKFIQYLSEPSRWQTYDADLYATLQRLLAGPGRRSVSLIEDTDLLNGCQYFSETVPDYSVSRQHWFARLRQASAEHAWVFLDPDNGLEVKSKPFGRKDSSKFLFWREVETLWEDGKSLLIYQHFIREKRGVFTSRIMDQLAKSTPGSSTMAFATSNVLFLMALQPHHDNKHDRIIELLRQRWAGQLTPTMTANQYSTDSSDDALTFPN